MVYYLPTQSLSKAFISENIVKYFPQKRPDRCTKHFHVDFVDFEYYTYSEVCYRRSEIGDRKSIIGSFDSSCSKIFLVSCCRLYSSHPKTKLKFSNAPLQKIFESHIFHLREKKDNSKSDKIDSRRNALTRTTKRQLRDRPHLGMFMTIFSQFHGLE